MDKTKEGAVSYHIDAGGPMELSPRAYQISILQYRFGKPEAELDRLSDQEITALYLQLTEG